MKFLNLFFGLLLLALCVSTSQADISLILRDKQYLPPPIQELPVDDNYYNSQENTKQQQHKFEESRYGNSKYEIFEVHNLYKPSANNGEKKSTKIRIEHINAPSDFPLDDPNLDAYLSITAFKGPDYLPPRQLGLDPLKQNFISNNNFDGSDYLPPHQHGTSHSRGNFEQTTSYQGQGYLKPYQHGSDQSELSFVPKPQFRGSDYLPPQQQTPHQSSYNSPENLSIKNNFKAPDYLPPLRENFELQKNTDFRPSVPFNGPNYLPPEGSHNINQNTHQQQQVTPIQNTGLRGPDYLPPHQQYKSSRIFKGTAFNGPDYLPPLERHIEQNQLLVGTLPPDYLFEKPPNAEQAIAELHTLPEDSQAQVTGRKQSSTKPENPEQSINPLHNQEITTNIQPLKVSKSSLPVYHFQKTFNSESSITGSSQQHNLPLGYGQALNRVNAEQNSYKANQAFVPDNGQNSKSEPFKGPGYLPPTTGPHTYKDPDYSPPTLRSQTYKSPDYLPPTSATQTFNGHDYLPPSTGSQNYESPEYLPPADSEQRAPVNEKQSFPESYQTQFKGPEYLQPNVPTNSQELNPPIMYPLSSFMSNVKPNDRYGNRKPFSEYGLPPVKTASMSLNNDISPMYREPTSRLPYYAPTMSYANNALNGQTTAIFKQNQYESFSALSQQAITLPAATPSKAKIRTVQISNPNTVKTLKVLESSDHAGVKTIKILGPSHDQPMGDHSVIKVVSGTHEATVQTVKFFNDHHDVKSNASGAAAVQQSNSYLPLRGKRNSNNKTKGKGSPARH